MAAARCPAVPPPANTHTYTAPTKRHHAAEPPDRGVELLDAGDQLVAGIDVHPRVFVAQPAPSGAAPSHPSTPACQVNVQAGRAGAGAAAAGGAWRPPHPSHRRAHAAVDTPRLPARVRGVAGGVTEQAARAAPAAAGDGAACVWRRSQCGECRAQQSQARVQQQLGDASNVLGADSVLVGGAAHERAWCLAAPPRTPSALPRGAGQERWRCVCVWGGGGVSKGAQPKNGGGQVGGGKNKEQGGGGRHCGCSHAHTTPHKPNAGVQNLRKKYTQAPVNR